MDLVASEFSLLGFLSQGGLLSRIICGIAMTADFLPKFGGGPDSA
jgi:hypothetical protein